MEKLKSISELAKSLKLINTKNNKPQNHVLRYWEKEFNQIKPQILNNRRYYGKKQEELICLIKYLLKDKGLTINGVKKVLKSNINTLDDYNSFSLKADYYKESIKTKSKIILNKIRQLKKDGKKNTP